MKKIFLSLLILSAASFAFAKKVKFMVDMDTITPNINGIHITGDFQDEAGFGTDWDPATTAMTQELSDPSVYSIVVNIPAFRNYEFKYVNGIFGYEVEFVPMESRVQHNFNDNRWVYIDSLSNDTQIVRPVLYEKNAPAGKYLLRFRVDMSNVPVVSPLGVHVAGTFQGWDPTQTYMHSFDGFTHEYITYVDTGNPAFEHQYKFFNGETGTQETVPLACANGNTNRGVFISKDSILATVCFASCSACTGSGVSENEFSSSLTIFPNPANDRFTVSSQQHAVHSIRVYNSLGRIVHEQTANSKQETVNLEVAKGIYLLQIESNGKTATSKLLIE